MSAAIIADNTTTKIISIGEQSTNLPNGGDVDGLTVPANQKYVINRILINLSTGGGATYLRIKSTTGVYFRVATITGTGLPIVTDLYKLESIITSDGTGLMLTFFHNLIVNAGESINYEHFSTSVTRKFNYLGEFTANSP